MPKSNGARPETFAATATPDVRAVIGVRGLSIWAGRVSEEYLTALASWDREVRTYLEMRDDPTVGTLLEAIKSPLLNAGVTVEPASDKAPDVEAAAWVERCLKEMDGQSWRSHVSDMLEALDFGFAIAEIVLEKRGDGRLWLKGLEPRGQETLYRWLTEPGKPDSVVGFEQHSFRGSQPLAIIPVPLDKCVHFAWRGRKGNPQGRSLLRAIYQAWWYLRNLQTFEGIGVERDVGGMPVLELPETLPTATQLDDIDKELAGLRQDARAYVRLPAGAKLTAYGGGTKVYDTDKIIQRWRRIILQRFFVQFLELGMEKAGTQALVKGSTDYFMLALEGIQAELEAVWNLQLVPYLMKWNRFEGLSGMPKVDWNSPGKFDAQALLDAYQKGVSSQVLTPTREDEEHVREGLDLPELPEGMGDQPRGQQAQVGPDGQPLQAEPGQDGQNPQQPAQGARPGRTPQEGRRGGGFAWPFRRLAFHLIGQHDQADHNPNRPGAGADVPAPRVKAGGLKTPSGVLVPRGWVNVRVATDKAAPLQAVGTDTKGRTQYLYSAEHSAQAAASKFARLKDFDSALPVIRERVDADRDRSDEAGVIWLIARTGFRVGSDRDTKAKVKAYGASTLEAKHVTIRGDTVRFQFTGKKGIPVTREIDDPEMAAFMRRRVKRGGRLFQTDDSRVRDYLTDITGEPLKVKDFRTWIGTSAATAEVARLEPPTDERTFRMKVRSVAKAVSEVLGNTPAVALSAYIDPAVWAPWQARLGKLGTAA